MKKLMTVAAAALCAAVGYGADAIESQVVGFQSYNAAVSDDMSTIGVAFANTAVADGDYVISDKIFNRDVEDSDQFLVWDNDMYNLINYTYYDGVGWVVTWADGSEEAVEGNAITIKKGQVIWFLPVTPDADTIVTGNVAPSGTQTLTFTPGGDEGDCFAFVNPFPVDTKFADLTTFCEDSDQFLLWDNANYNLINYTYYDGVGWVITDALGAETAASEEDIAIPAGQGAYFLPCEERTWTVTFTY